MKTPYRLIARQIRARILAGAGDIDKVDVLGSEGTPILPNLHPTKRAGAIVVHGESGIDHALNVGLDPATGHVAEAHPAHRYVAVHEAKTDDDPTVRDAQR